MYEWAQSTGNPLPEEERERIAAIRAARGASK